MPDTKVTALAAYATVHTDDLLSVVDVHDTSMAASGTDKKWPISSLDARYMTIWASLSGTAGRIPYQGAGGALADSASLQWDATNSHVIVVDPTATTAFVKIGRLPSSSGYVGIWFSTATPSATNYAFLSDAPGNVLVNGQTTLGLGAAHPMLFFKSQTNAVAGYGANGFAGYSATTSLTAIAGTAAYTPLDLVGFASQAAALLRLRQYSSTSVVRSCGIIDATFNSATDATWTGNLLLYAGDNTSSHAGKRLGVQVQSDGTQARLGFYGATPVAKAAAPTTLADVIAILRNLGLCT